MRNYDRPAISLAAKRYAKAFFESAKEAGESDELLSNWRCIEAAVAVPGMQQMLRDPSLRDENKLQALARVFSQPWPDTTRNSARMILEARRYEVFEEMAAALQEESDSDQGVLRVIVRSAHPVSAEQMERLQRLIERKEGKRLVIDARIDKELIGGIQIVLDHRVIDGSVAHQLQELRHYLRHVQIH